MKKLIWVSAAFLILGLLAFGLVLSRDSAAYHFSEFESIKTNFNDYRPSLYDRLTGIRDNQSKWDYHLQKLVEIGAVQHKRFVFTEVPYTREASKHIWRAANSNFPNAVMFTGTYYDTNATGYGRDPYVLAIWDVPSEMARWSSFFETNNQMK
jgi:hypothetical protein